MNSPLADIGAELRQARESQRRSLDDLSHETLIHVRHLLALEDGRDADLPEPFYVKNFIRKYANALGLSGDAMANRYWDTRPLPEHPPKPPAAPDFLVPWWVFPAMLGALLLGAIGTFAVMNGNKQPVAAATGIPGTEAGLTVASESIPASGAMQAAATEAADPEEAGASPATESAALAGAATGDRTVAASPSDEATAAIAVAPTPTPTPGPLNLPPLVVPGHQIKFQTHNKEAAWMQIVADGRELHSGVMGRNMVRTWTASRSLAVRIGKPGVVTARLGDRPLGTLGPKDAPVFRRTFLTREGEVALLQARAGNQPDARTTPGPKHTPPPVPLEKPTSAPAATPGSVATAAPDSGIGTSSDAVSP